MVVGCCIKKRLEMAELKALSNDVARWLTTLSSAALNPAVNEVSGVRENARA